MSGFETIVTDEKTGAMIRTLNESAKCETSEKCALGCLSPKDLKNRPF
jgi:hypothetical protein